MGRRMQPLRLSRSQTREIELSRAVDHAITQLLRTRRLTIIDDVAEEHAGLQADGAAASPPPVARYRAPLVFLDGLEVTQEIQDLSHSVPLVADRPTVVRAYLRYAQAATVRGELLVARSEHGPWQSVPSLGPAQLDPARAGSSPAQLRSRRRDLTFSLNFRLPDHLASAGRLWLRMGRGAADDRYTVAVAGRPVRPLGRLPDVGAAPAAAGPGALHHGHSPGDASAIGH